VFLPFIIITAVLWPMAFAYELAVDVPRILMNLWYDISSSVCDNWQRGSHILCNAWKDWLKAFRKIDEHNKGNGSNRDEVVG